MNQSTAQTTKLEQPGSATRVLVVSAHGTNGFESDVPLYCAIQVNTAFIQRIEALIALCGENKLTRVAVSEGPELWGPAGIEEEAKLQQAELVVCANGEFWFTDYPKYQPWLFESKRLTVNMVQQYLSLNNEDIVFVSEVLKEYYQEDH